MSWRYVDITTRPIDLWPGEQTRSRRRAPFGANWGSTVKIVEHELRQLNARQVVMQLAITEEDIRLDGKPRAHARASHPGVILAFESKWGPLKFSVDTFDQWQDNLRAIALGMEALRKVDRYGVTKRGEQYTGWKALPASTDPADAIQTVEQARAVLAEYGGDLRRALMETHPDRGGNETDFRRVTRARELLS